MREDYLDEIEKNFGDLLNNIELNCEDNDVMCSDLIYYDYKSNDFLFNYIKFDDDIKIIITDDYDCFIKNDDNIFKINTNIIGSNCKNKLYDVHVYKNFLTIGNYYVDLQKQIILIINLKENKIIMYLDSLKNYDAFDIEGNKIEEFCGYDIDTYYNKLLEDLSEYYNLMYNINLIKNDR